MKLQHHTWAHLRIQAMLKRIEDEWLLNDAIEVRMPDGRWITLLGARIGIVPRTARRVDCSTFVAR